VRCFILERVLEEVPEWMNRSVIAAPESFTVAEWKEIDRVSGEALGKCLRGQTRFSYMPI
jgi:hypothetical protein